MGNNYVLNADGDAVATDDLLKWARWFEKAERHLGKDTVGGVTISTVFLGIDHSFGQGPPLLWETMVFNGEHDEAQERYSTKEDALAGHARWVGRVQPNETTEES